MKRKIAAAYCLQFFGILSFCSTPHKTKYIGLYAIAYSRLWRAEWVTPVNINLNVYAVCCCYIVLGYYARGDSVLLVALALLLLYSMLWYSFLGSSGHWLANSHQLHRNHNQ